MNVQPGIALLTVWHSVSLLCLVALARCSRSGTHRRRLTQSNGATRSAQCTQRTARNSSELCELELRNRTLATPAADSKNENQKQNSETDSRGSLRSPSPLRLRALLAVGRRTAADDGQQKCGKSGRLIERLKPKICLVE